MKRLIVILLLCFLAAVTGTAFADQDDIPGLTYGAHPPTATPAPTPVPTPKPTPVPTPSPTPVIYPTSGSPEFEGTFDRAEEGELFYHGKNVSVDITPMRYDGSDVWIADVYVRSLDQFCRSFGRNRWGALNVDIEAHAAQSVAVLAVNGDSSYVFGNGLVMGNGVIQHSSMNNVRDLAVLWKDGTLVTYRGSHTRELHSQTDQIWSTFLFGPALLNSEGKKLTEKNMTHAGIAPRNPRTVLGYYEPGHYCLVVADGRKTESHLAPGEINKGIDIYSLAQMMEDLGCKAAYNLDGGQSSVMWFRGRILSYPYHGGRRVNDAIVVIDR